ncbi:hypothetical protein BC832DRAFT_425309 [Gaertneriomyces semiglobifer]|nr:hypothetical protein BC832DRAFT_425309 [Gaertneriomyces semiglobifer]
MNNRRRRCFRRSNRSFVEMSPVDDDGSTVEKQEEGSLVEKQKEVHPVLRYIQENVYARVVVSVLRTTRNTISAPFCLASDGSNNPIDLPNIRVRDALLLFIGGTEILDVLGLDHFLDDTVFNLFGANDNAVGEWVVQQMASEVLDTLIHEPLLNQITSLVPTGAGLTGRIISKEIVATHSSCNSLANLQLYLGPYGTQKRSAFRKVIQVTVNYMDCSKAWYCRYLYATNRSPFGIPRYEDPTVIACLGPLLYCVNFTAYEIT